ncbi:inorganic phosphate transporter [Lichenihabitans psoromatis]|uniref:inorganic phosphate transporter n=1 Tax=Lichenihabitans psoromatis TaxID=2528642 RepID=UPI00103662E6|nr:inorganic phosphate transporter [Lichenihabitans psoromatis]
MLAALTSGSTAAFVLMIGCLILVLAFEFSNGFHDTANAVATVIYTKSLKPTVAVVWSGLMNFAGVLLGGIAVAYALVELIPPDVLSPPGGGLAIGMLAALFVTALVWNVATWAFGIPNSSSHALIGALVGVAIENALVRGRDLHSGVDWNQVWSVLLSLLVSPVLGFVFSLLLFYVIKALIHDKALYTVPEEGKPPVWWMRGLLILTCTGVSFSHGTNDGQKSIGLIMLTVIGLAPAVYAINQDIKPEAIQHLSQAMPQAADLIGRFGDDQKQLGVEAAKKLGETLGKAKQITDIPDAERIATRNDLNRTISELHTVSETKEAPDDAKKSAKSIGKDLSTAVQYVPWWVRILSAVCLGLGTMVGYKRIVETLGERIGKEHLVPAQGASAELVAAVLIGGAGITGFPVSTTHVVTAGIAGTMVGSGSGIQPATLWQIGTAWLLTLPATMLMSGLILYVLS